MKKLSIFIILAISFIISTAYSNETQDMFAKANDFYKKSNYLSAIDTYNKILGQGFESAELYYNLGNSYYRMNRIPEAIINYERAKRIANNDEDINYNLSIANLKTIDKIEPVPQFFLFEWLKSIKNLFNSTSWATVSIIFLWLGLIILGGFYLFWSSAVRKFLFSLAMISFIISISSFIFSYQGYNYEITRDDAIIFDMSVYVKSSPEATSTDLFILHEGTKVKVLDEIGEWKKIRIANGNVGWLQAKSIEVI